MKVVYKAQNPGESIIAGVEVAGLRTHYTFVDGVEQELPEGHAKDLIERGIGFSQVEEKAPEGNVEKGKAEEKVEIKKEAKKK